MQTLSPLDSLQSDRILCYYVNTTSQIQILRISSIPGWYFERAVFPRQRLMFEATPEAQLEVYTAKEVGAILSERISCDHLQVQDETESPEFIIANSYL